MTNTGAHTKSPQGTLERTSFEVSKYGRPSSDLVLYFEGNIEYFAFLRMATNLVGFKNGRRSSKELSTVCKVGSGEEEIGEMILRGVKVSKCGLQEDRVN